MSDKGLFLQNIIAIIWDFDKTLSPKYMQAPLFRAYDVDEKQFWNEVNALPDYYKRAGISIQPDTSYLCHLLTYVNEGIMPDLCNARLRELGAEIDFFPGIPELFTELQAVLEAPEYREGDLRLEHYVVSTGLTEMIRGSKIAQHLSGIWASEFIESPARPGADLSGVPESGPIAQIAGFLDNTTKTRAIFEINKGVHKLKNVSVNDLIPEEDRRVPMKNMIYVAFPVSPWYVNTADSPMPFISRGPNPSSLRSMSYCRPIGSMPMAPPITRPIARRPCGCGVT